MFQIATTQQILQLSFVTYEPVPAFLVNPTLNLNLHSPHQPSSQQPCSQIPQASSNNSSTLSNSHISRPTNEDDIEITNIPLNNQFGSYHNLQNTGTFWLNQSIPVNANVSINTVNIVNTQLQGTPNLTPQSININNALFILVPVFHSIFIPVAPGQNIQDILNHLQVNNLNLNGNPPASSREIEKLQRFKPTEENLKEECPICKDNYKQTDQLMKMPCNHIFHETCLSSWLKLRNSCPNCRMELKTDNQFYEQLKESRKGSV